MPLYIVTVRPPLHSTKAFQNSQQGYQLITRGTWKHLKMMMSLKRITKMEAVCIMPYWGRLGCFIKGALRMKDVLKGWRQSWDCQNIMWGKQIIRQGSIMIGMARRLILLTRCQVLSGNICFHILSFWRMDEWNMRNVRTAFPHLFRGRYRSLKEQSTRIKGRVLYVQPFKQSVSL